MIKQDDLIQNRYQVLRLLGSGGFGAVYLAKDVRLGRAVAVKEMDVERLGPDERPLAEQLFEQEARMLASLDHPGLTRVWDYFQLDRRAFLVMEYVPGVTLRELLHKRGGPLDEPFVLECALQLCAVLQYLHTRRPQVIFRDLKPANVMVVEPQPAPERGEPPERPVFRLIDFGIARLFKPEQTGDTQIIGTPGYAPPEQYGQSQTDERSDIYSLGATLHNLLSGQPPSSVPPPPLGSINPAVSPELAQAIARATAPEPNDRYQNVEALRQDVLAIQRADRRPAPELSERPAAPTPPYAVAGKATSQLPPPARAPAPPQQSSAMPMIAIVLVVLAIIIFGTLGTRAFNRLSDQSGSNAPAGPATSGPAPAGSSANEWRLPGATGTIAFGQRDPQGGFDIWLATLDGQPPKRMTNDRQSYSPAWSAEGARISFNHNRDIYIGTAAQPLQKQLDLAGIEARYPAWSPDGRQIAMATKDGARPWRLTIVDLASGEISFPSSPEDVGGVAWSPGQLITFAAHPAPGQPQDIFVLDETGVAQNVTNTPQVEEDLPSWSPDGRRLAFAASPANQLDRRQIVTINADGGGRSALTTGSGPHTNPVWSPDGAWIAYVAQENSPDWQVWAMRADGSEPRVLTFGPERKFYLSWGK